MIATGANGLVAGPLTTEPSLTLNLLPWHGQSMVPFETLLTMQPWCVHTALNALKVPACGYVITMFLPSMILPPPSGTSAVVASAAAAGPAPLELTVLVAVFEAAAPPAVAALLVAGAGPASPPLLASYVVQPVSIGAQVEPAPISTARRLCACWPPSGMPESSVFLIGSIRRS